MQYTQLCTAALDLDKVAHWFAVKFDHPAAARHFSHYCGLYPANLRDFIKDLDHALPRTDQGNCNHWYRIGREGTRVVYLELVKTYTTADWAKVKRALHKIGAQYDAYENGPKEEDEVFLSWRFWWDG